MRLALLIGSPDRIGVLDALIDHDLKPAVVVVPEKRHSEGLRADAEKRGIDSRTVTRASTTEVIKQLSPQVSVTIGWPYLFGSDFLEGPWLALNSHPTLLPAYRGPNPWWHIIANGEAEAGVTVHKIDLGMDSGPILHQEKVELSPFDTYRSLKAKLLDLEPKVVVHAISRVQQNDYEFVAQDESKASVYLGFRRPEDSEIDPRSPLLALYHQIRACDPDRFPAFFYFEGQKICIRLWRPLRPESDHPESL